MVRLGGRNWGPRLPQFPGAKRLETLIFHAIQKRDALRVARIPEPEFEAAVESDDPPTVTRMIEERKPQPLK